MCFPRPLPVFYISFEVMHYAAPPIAVLSNVEAAANAMKWSLLHHGFHGWSIYTIAGLAMAFFSYNRGLPLTVSATFKPLLGKISEGLVGHLIDITTVVASLFGVALSLIIAAQLLSIGLYQTLGMPDTIAQQLGMLGFVTLNATLSVVLG